MTARFPLTGHVRHEGFGAFLEAELGEPRRNLRLFARELSATFGVPTPVLVNSGSSANLTAALTLAEELPAGAPAIVSAFTFPTTVSALLTAGLRVHVVDTEPGTFNMDPGALRDTLVGGPGIVAITHFLGYSARIDELVTLAHDRGWKVLQDACETMTLRRDGRPVHERGDLTTWSFYHPHHLSSFGGGAVIAPDDDARRRLESITHWGRACTCHVEGLPCVAPPGVDHQFHYVRPGHNLELSELNACFGRWQLRTWPDQEARRKRHFSTLFAALKGSLMLRLHPAPADDTSPFVFPITVKSGDRASLASALLARGVEVRSLMGGVIVDQPAYRGLAYDSLANARALAAASFFVGLHQTLSDDDVAAVASIVRELAQ